MFCSPLPSGHRPFANKSRSLARRTPATAWLHRLTLFASLAVLLVGLGVSASLAQEVDMHNPIGVKGIFNGNVATGCSYDPLSHSAHREVTDIAVPGSIGKYPLKMTRYYNSRHQLSGAMGPGWTFEYYWGLSTDGKKLTYPNGNVLDTSCLGAVGVSDRWQTGPACGQNCSGDFRLADGGTVHFVNGRVTAIDDPYGQTTTITYAGDLSWMKVTEPGGRYLYFTYNGPQSRLSRVEAHGLGNATVTDWVNYHYDLQSPGGNGASLYSLTRVDYSDGTSATYTYTQDNVQSQYKVLPLLSTASDVRYSGPMRQIAFSYQGYPTPHGAITAEKYGLNGPTVSSISPGATVCTTFDCQMETDFTETRGDGPTRTFHYTDLTYSSNPQEPGCPAVQYPQPPSQFLLSYTDFKGNTTTLGYDVHWYVNSVKDGNNHTTYYTRGANIGEITQIKHPDLTHIDYIYYDEVTGHIDGHYLKQATDERGNVTFYGRDGNNQVTYIWYEDNLGNVLAGDGYGYDNFGQVTTHLLKNGAFESFVYNSRGLLTDKYNPKFDAIPGGSDPHTHYDYYTSGPWTDRVMKVTLPANFPSNLQASETYEYDRALDANGVTDLNGAAVAGRGLVTKITHGDNTYQRFKYDAYGNKRWEDNELRQATSYTYDDYNRVLTVTNPLYKTTSYTYKPTNGNGTNPYLHTTNNPDTITTPVGIVTTNVYDQNFRKTSSTVGSSTTSFDYDAVGNLTWITDPLIHKTYNTYDTRNRKLTTTEAYGTSIARTTTWHYDAANNIYQIDRPDTTTETKTFDPLNRMLTDTVPKDNNTTITTTFTYNPSGTIGSIKDGNNHITTFDYDASDQKLTMTYPGGSGTQSWAYDDAHNLITRTTVNGETQYFGYDIRNRKWADSWSNWDDSVRNPDWRYFAYDATGRLTEAENGTNAWATNVISDVHRSYNAAGQLIQEQQIVTGLGALYVNYPSYDDDGRLTRMYVSGLSGFDFTYSYDAMGRFEKVSLTPSTTLFQYHYDAASNETERDNLFNLVNQFTPRDALNRITTWDAKKGASTLTHESYTYDAMNRITVVNYGAGPTDSFSYYRDGELNQATLGNLAHALTYNLDNAGNRTSVVDNNVTSTYSPNTINQYTTGAGSSVVNGPEHEIQSYNGVAYTYINDERLLSAASGSTYSMVYDALGRCLKRSLSNGPTTYYFYDGEKPILEYDAGGTAVGNNVYGKGIDEILERIAIGSDGNWYSYFPQQNHEGSVTLLTDVNGSAIERYRYDAFGAPTVYTGTWATRAATIYDNRFLFTGREYAATYRSTHTTPAFNFYEYRARAYNPKLGRFMSEDPKVFDAGDYNLFRYCHNDPVDMTDPMGLDEATGRLTSGTHDRVWGIDEKTAKEMDLRDALRNAVQQALRQAARARAYAKADSWSGHGIGRIADVNYATSVQNNMKVLTKMTVHENADRQLRPGQKATTTAPLSEAVAVEGPDGMIVRQLLPIDVYLAKNASLQQRGKEMSNAFSLKNWAEDDVGRIVAPLRNVQFASPEAAAAAMDRVVRPSYNTIYFQLKMKDSPLGENIIHE
jgi:RHS repeat-associated protein